MNTTIFMFTMVYGLMGIYTTELIQGYRLRDGMNVHGLVQIFLVGIWPLCLLILVPIMIGMLKAIEEEFNEK